MRVIVLALALSLSGCAVSYQSIGSRQFGWTIGPATMTTTTENAHAGWCWSGDVVLQPGEE